MKKWHPKESSKASQGGLQKVDTLPLPTKIRTHASRKQQIQLDFIFMLRSNSCLPHTELWSNTSGTMFPRVVPVHDFMRHSIWRSAPQLALLCPYGDKCKGRRVVFSMKIGHEVMEFTIPIKAAPVIHLHKSCIFCPVLTDEKWMDFCSYS